MTIKLTFAFNYGLYISLSCSLISDSLNNKEITYFQRFYREHNVIGYLEYTTTDGTDAGRVVLKMKPGYKAWTPYGTARDCGTHYILAQYSRYDRIQKKDLEVTEDADDK